MVKVRRDCISHSEATDASTAATGIVREPFDLHMPWAGAPFGPKGFVQ